MHVCGFRLAHCLIIGQDMCHPCWQGCACVWVMTCSVPYYRATYLVQFTICSICIALCCGLVCCCWYRISSPVGRGHAYMLPSLWRGHAYMLPSRWERTRLYASLPLERTCLYAPLPLGEDTPICSLPF